MDKLNTASTSTISQIDLKDFIMMKSNILLAAGSALFLISTSTVIADDDTGWFLGASVNRLSADQKSVEDVDFEDSDNAFGLKGGYMFSNLFGLEAGYIDLGDYKTQGNEKGVNLNLDAEGWYLAGVLNFTPADNWDLYAKLGAFVLDTNSNLTEFDDSTTEVYGGIGVEYDFGDWNIFGEFSAVNTDVNDLTTDILSLGLKYEFPR